MKHIFLISKEILRKDLLGIYNGRNKTPHIDAIAGQGSVFNNYYTSGSSTAMAVTTMFSGLDPYELSDRERYEEVGHFNQTETLFKKMSDRGYECHVLWPWYFDDYVEPYLKIFDPKVVLHSVKSIMRYIPSTRDWSMYQRMEQVRENACGADILLEKISSIMNAANKPVFLWMHLPHVLLPHHSYEEDIGDFDALVGSLNTHFDAEFFITADHGQQRGEKGEHMYGFTVYEGTTNIPLITPSLSIGPLVDFPVGSNQLMNIILDRTVEQTEFVYSDTTYYKQRHRVFMIRSDMYKYVYNKFNKCEELYDLEFDPQEQLNLLKRYYYVSERGIYYPFEELFQYPHWPRAEKYYRKLSSERKRLWRTGSIVDHMKGILYDIKNKFVFSINA